MLYILTSKQVLCMPFAGRNCCFSSFLVNKEGKRTKYNKKYPKGAISSIWELLQNASRDFVHAKKVELNIFKHWKKYQLGTGAEGYTTHKLPNKIKAII